jgi:hypothetical protein
MDLQDVWSSVEHLTSVGGGGMKVHKRESSVFDLVADMPSIRVITDLPI